MAVESENDLSGRVGLDTTVFKTGIAELTKQVKSIETSFRASAAVMGDWSNSTSGLQERVTSLSQKLDLQKQKLNVLHEEYDKLRNAEGDNSKAMESLANKMYSAEKAIDSTKKDLDKYTVALKDAQKEEKESGSATAKLKKSFDDISKASEKTASAVKTHMSGIKSAFLGAMAVLGTKVSLDGITGMAEEAEQTQAQLDAVLKSTGGAAGWTKKNVDDLSKSLSQNTTYAADSVTSTQGMLLTFTNIGKNVMPAATESVLNMATAMKTDTKSAAVQLGKALNDPTKGLTALTRVGVTFTDAQKKQITAMQKAGDTAGAQKIILGELQKEFGGSAKAAGDTFSGKIQIAKNSIHDMGEEVSVALIPVIQDIMPKLVQAAKNLANFVSSHKEDIAKAAKSAEDSIKKVFDFIQQHSPAIKGAILGIGGALATWKVISTISKITSTVSGAAAVLKKGSEAATPAVANLAGVIKALPILGIVAAIALAVGAFVYLWNNCEGFRNFWIKLGSDLQSAAQTAWSEIQSAIMTVWNIIGPTIIDGIQTVQQWWNKIWPEVQETFSDVWAVMKIILTPIVAYIDMYIRTTLIALQLVWKVAWGSIKDTFKLIWDLIVGIIKTAWTIISGVIKTALDLITGIFKIFKDLFTGNWSALWDDVKSLFSNIWNDISGIFQGVVGNIGDIFKNLASDALQWGKDIINNIVDGIKSAASAVGDAVKGVAQDIRKFLHFSVPDEGPLVDFESWMPDFMQGLASGIESNRYKVAAAMRSLASDMSVSVPVSPAYSGGYSAAASTVQATSTPSSTTNNFYQYNTSPKALTPSETARQTRNLLRQARLKSR